MKWYEEDYSLEEVPIIKPISINEGRMNTVFKSTILPQHSFNQSKPNHKHNIVGDIG